MITQHTTLNAALSTIEQLVSQGHQSFKLFRSEGKVWNVIVNAVQAPVRVAAENIADD